MNAAAIRRYRTVFLSDFHMGAKSFDAKALLAFLKSMHCDYLFLVGDIIDGWKLHKRWHWPEEYNRIFDELARKVHKGTKIIYLAGNHDDEMRALSPLRQMKFTKKYHVKIKDKVIHTMADGRRFLVLHGDQFDRKILRGPLSKWSDHLYDLMMDLINGYRLPHINIDGQMKPFSLAKFLTRHGQKALIMLNNFENAAHKMAKRLHVDGVICGHTHIPVIKPLRDITYANAGSWLRSGHTALIEHDNGQLALLDWPATYEAFEQRSFNPLFQDQTQHVRMVADASRFRPVTQRIVSHIEEVWQKERTPKNKTTHSETDLHDIKTCISRLEAFQYYVQHEEYS